MHTKTLRGEVEKPACKESPAEQLELLWMLLEEMLAFEPEKRLPATGVSHRLNRSL